MNSRHDDDRLDELLSDWAGQSVFSERLEILQQRILLSAAEARSVDSNDVKTASQPVREPGRWSAGFAVGVAATLLVSLCVFLAVEQRQLSIVATTDVPPEFTWLRGEQLQSKTLLLSELESLFDGQLVWLAESGDRVELGLDESAARIGHPGEANPLAIRVVVVRRERGRADWQVAWAMDVTSPAEEQVRVTPRDANGDELRLWAYELPDGLIAVDCDVQLGGDHAFRSATTTLCKDGQPQEVAAVSQNGVEYRVFQTVARLDREVG
ncbi:hypothetical protein GC176_06895 [bacterium]|nr:hypothetical protein [bacterium]